MTEEQHMSVVLTVLNENRRTAKSANMMAMTASQVGLKAKRKTGFESITQQEVLVALDYMNGNQVKSVTTKHKVGMSPGAKVIAKRMGRSSNPSVSVTRWKITQKGVVMLEGANEYTRKAPAAKITVNANNSQVIIGNDNILSGKIEVVDKLTELEQVISESTVLSLEEKQDAVADIESIKAQLGKPNPALSIIRALWSPVTLAADASGAIGLASSIAKMLGIN